MTIIAYRNSIMAADTAVFGADIYPGSTVKILKTSSGWLVGASGHFGKAQQFLKRANVMALGKETKSFDMDGCPVGKDDDFRALLVSPIGAVYTYESGTVFTLTASYYAIGCGMAVAFGAMHAGAGAVEAVEAACHHDSGCRLPLSVIKLDRDWP